MEQNPRFPNFPENYVYYPLKYYQNFSQWTPQPQRSATPNDRFVLQQNVPRPMQRNHQSEDRLTNTFMNSVHQFQCLRNDFPASQRQLNTHRQVNYQNILPNRHNFNSNQRSLDPRIGNFNSMRHNFTQRNSTMDHNSSFRMPNSAYMNHQMHQRFNLPCCPQDSIPPLLPSPMPPLLPPPLPPLPQFQGQRFINNGYNYNNQNRIPLQNRFIEHDNIPNVHSRFHGNDINCQDPYRMDFSKQNSSSRSTENQMTSKPPPTPCQILADIENEHSEVSVNCVISENASTTGYTESLHCVVNQPQDMYKDPLHRLPDSRYVSDGVERSNNIKLTSTSQNLTPKSPHGKSQHAKYERLMKISLLSNSVNVRCQNDNVEEQKSQELNADQSNHKKETWSFDSPLKLSVKRIESSTSKNNVSMNTVKENVPRVVPKRLCKSTVKKYSKYQSLTSPNHASTPAEIHLLNYNKRSISENNICTQKNKLHKFEMAKLESKHFDPLWLSPILSENEQSKGKRTGNETHSDSNLKTLGRSRPMIKSRKCNRNLFDNTQNQRGSCSKSQDKSIGKSQTSSLQKATIYTNQADISAVELECSRLESSVHDLNRNRQTKNLKSGYTAMPDPCVVTMPTDLRNSTPSNFFKTINDNTGMDAIKSLGFGSKPYYDDTMQASSMEDFVDNIGTSDHEGAVAENSTLPQEADDTSDDRSHCSSNLSQYSTVYDDFKEIQAKAIEEANESKRVQKSKELPSFWQSKKKWHLQSNTYPLFSPVRRSLADKAEFKNRARHSQGFSVPERISLAPCKIVIEDLVQMKNRFDLIQRKSQNVDRPATRDLKSSTVSLKTSPPCQSKISTKDLSQIGKIPQTKRPLSSDACYGSASSLRNRYSSESSTSTKSSLVDKIPKSTRSTRSYFDTATSKLVKVYLPSKSQGPKTLKQPTLKSHPSNQKLTNYLPTKVSTISKPRSVDTRPRNFRSPLTNKKLTINVLENNLASARKLRPGGLGVEWAEVQSGSPFGSVKKKAMTRKYPSEAKLDSNRTSLTDSRGTLLACRRSRVLIDDDMSCHSDVSTGKEGPDDVESMACDLSGKGGEKTNHIERLAPTTSISTFEKQTVYDKPAVAQGINQISSICEASYTPYDECLLETDTACTSDGESVLSTESRKKSVDIESKSSDVPKQQDRQFDTCKENLEEKKIPSSRKKHDGTQSSKLSTGRLKSPIKTRLSHGIRRKEKFMGSKSGSHSPISKKIRISDNQRSPRKQSVQAVGTISKDKKQRGRPPKNAIVSKNDGRSVDYKSTPLMDSKNCPANRKERTKGIDEEVPVKRRCTEEDTRCAILRSKSDRLPHDALLKKNSSHSIKSQNASQQKKQPVWRNSTRLKPSSEYLQKYTNNPNLKGLSCKEKPISINSKLIVSKSHALSHGIRKSTTRKTSESSENDHQEDEEPADDASSTEPTTDNSTNSPKAKKIRSAKEMDVLRSFRTKGSSPASNLPEYKKVVSAKLKQNKSEKERFIRLMEIQSARKSFGKKNDALKSSTQTEKNDSDNQEHHLSDSSQALSKTNSDQIKPKRKHRRVEKHTGKDNNNVVPSHESIQNTRHQRKRSRSKADVTSKQQVHGTAQKEQPIQKQSTAQKQRDNQTQAVNPKIVPRKPKLVITQGVKKGFWCKFCYSFRGTFADLKVHVGEKHPYKCQTCKAVFDSGVEAENHRKAHISKLYHCKLCQRDLRFCEGIIERHERSIHHRQLVRVQKQILELILNKHGTQSLDGQSTEFPDLSQFADLIRFPSAVATTDNTQTRPTEGQNFAITRFYFENQEIQSLLSKVEQSLKETNTKKATEVVLPQTSSSVVDQDQPIKIASVQPMVPTSNSQPITEDMSENQPIEFQPEDCDMNFQEGTTKPDQLTSQSAVVIESKSVMNTSGYQLPETNSALACPDYGSAQSNKLKSQGHNYSTPYTSDGFDFDMNFTVFGSAKSDKSSENVLSDFLTASKKMTSTEVPDDILEFWSSNYYQNVDCFYDNFPTFGLSSNPAPVPVSVPQISVTYPNLTSNVNQSMKIMPEKNQTESVSIVDISHSSVRMEKHMPFAEKTYPNAQNYDFGSELSNFVNFTQNYQTPIMSTTCNNAKSIINRPSATVTSADLNCRESEKNDGISQFELAGKAMNVYQKDVPVTGGAQQFVCQGKTTNGAYPQNAKVFTAQNSKVVQLEPGLNQSTTSLADKFSATSHSGRYPEKTIYSQCKSLLPGKSAENSESNELQNCLSTNIEISNLTQASDPHSDICTETKQQLADSEELNEDFQQTDVLDRLLQPLFSETFSEYRPPSKHQKAVSSDSLGKVVDNVHKSPLKNIQSSNTGKSSAQKIPSSPSNTQDTAENLTKSEKHQHQTSYETRLSQTNGSQDCIENTDITMSGQKYGNKDITQDVVNSYDEESSNRVLTSADVQSKCETFNFENNQNIPSSEPDKNSKLNIKTVTDLDMESYKSVVENTGEVILDTEEEVDGLDDHNDTLMNNISTLDDPDFSLTSFINAVLPEEPLSSSKLPMKSLLDISESDLKIAEAESSIVADSSDIKADERHDISENFKNVTNSETTTPDKGIESPHPKSKIITASEFIRNLTKEFPKPFISTNKVTEKVEVNCDVGNLDSPQAHSSRKVLKNIPGAVASSSEELVADNQTSATKKMDLSKDKNLDDSDISERKNFFSSLKLCQSTQQFSNIEPILTNSDTASVECILDNSDTDTASVEFTLNNSDTDTASSESGDNILDYEDDNCAFLDNSQVLKEKEVKTKQLKPKDQTQNNIDSLNPILSSILDEKDNVHPRPSQSMTDTESNPTFRLSKDPSNDVDDVNPEIAQVQVEKDNQNQDSTATQVSSEDTNPQDVYLQDSVLEDLKSSKASLNTVGEENDISGPLTLRENRGVDPSQDSITSNNSSSSADVEKDHLSVIPTECETNNKPPTDEVRPVDQQFNKQVADLNRDTKTALGQCENNMKQRQSSYGNKASVDNTMANLDQDSKPKEFSNIANVKKESLDQKYLKITKEHSGASSNPKPQTEPSVLETILACGDDSYTSQDKELSQYLGILTNSNHDLLENSDSEEETQIASWTPKSKSSLNRSISKSLPCIVSVLMPVKTKRHNSESDSSMQENTQNSHQSFHSSGNVSIQLIEPEVLALNTLTSPCEKLRNCFHEKYLGANEDNRVEKSHDYSEILNDKP